MSVVRSFLLVACLGLTPLAAHAAETATLTIKVEHVSAKGGDLRLALYDARDYNDDDHPLADKVVPAVAGETIVVWEGLAPGTYAIKMMQDENRNGKMDDNWFGLPREPYGLSNDAQPDLLHLSPPPFDAAKFTLHAGNNRAVITLRRIGL
jgi:uncharacterized protein (DUF2141 family)